MPNIREAQAPGDLGLRPDDRAAESTANAGRRISSAYGQAAEATNDMGRRLVNGGMDVGNVAVKWADHEQITTGSAYGAKLFDNLSKSKDDAVKGIDPADPAYGQKVEVALKKWRETELEPSLDNFKSGFSTENSQAWADHFVDQTRNKMFVATASEISTAAGIGIRNGIAGTINVASNTALREPWSVSAQLDLVDHAITGIVASSPIKGVEGAKMQSELLDKARKQIVMSGAQGAIQQAGDPERAAKEWAAKYPEYLDGQAALRLASEARSQIRARNADDNYRLKNQQMEKQDASDNRERDYLDKIHSDDPKERASVSAKNIANDRTLTREASERMIGMVERSTKPETDAKISRETTVELFNRMRNDDNADPVKMKNWIDDAYSAGNLSWGDRTNLIKEVEDRKTPEGLALAQDRAQFFKQYAGAIAGRTYDPVIGSPKLYIAERDARRIEQDLKQRNLDPHLAYDPSSEYFVGKKVQKWAGSMQDDLSTKAATPAPRNDVMPAIPPPDQRTAGSLYETPKGKMEWTGTGWIAPKGGAQKFADGMFDESSDDDAKHVPGGADHYKDFRKSENVEDRRGESSLVYKLKRLLAGDDAMSPREWRKWESEQPVQVTNALSKALGLVQLYKAPK